MTQTAQARPVTSDVVMFAINLAMGRGELHPFAVDGKDVESYVAAIAKCKAGGTLMTEPLVLGNIFLVTDMCDWATIELALDVTNT